MTERSIDVFCHILPPEYDAAVRRRAARPLALFDGLQAMPVMIDIASRLRLMDRFPGYQQVPCLASPPLESLASPEHTPELAWIANDALSKLVARHPDRFPSFVAAIPWNAPEAARAEAERACLELGAAGVQIYNSVNGCPLDAPHVLDLLGWLAEHKKAVWLHPFRERSVPDYPTETESQGDLWWALGWPHETSLAMCRLVFAGLFDRWPNLVVITHHAGGTVPMLEGRLDAGLALMRSRHSADQAAAARLRLPPLDALRRFHADTASFGSRLTIETGLRFFGPERMLFATDMPFDAEQGPGHIRETLRILDEMELAPETKTAILSGNACRALGLPS